MKNVIVALSLFTLISCQKELEGDTVTPGTGTSCSGTKMYLITKDGGSSLGKDSFAYDSQNRMTYAKFNSSGRIATPANATFTYDANGRIVQSVVRENSSNNILDTYGFAYRQDNKLDSIYSIGTPGNNYKLVYNSSNKLIKIIEYSMPSNTSDFHVDITTDDRNNITRAVDWFMGSSDADLSFTYDTKNNPLSGYAFFFAGLDDIEDLVKYYGPNNFIDQTAKLNTGSGIITVITGEKYDYNSNCYPVKDYITVNGAAPFPNDPDFVYTYK